MIRLVLAFPKKTGDCRSVAEVSLRSTEIISPLSHCRSTMVAATVQAPCTSSKTESFVNNKCKDDICQQNIVATRVVADAVRTNLGPKGMDKMIQTASGEVIITNDDATILNKMEVLPFFAKEEHLFFSVRHAKFFDL
ncbi:hypothetical protein Ancab_030458 [Ancistrocladus abbreviatus]